MESNSENNDEESRDDFEDPLASEEFSLNQFFQDVEDESETYYDAADLAQAIEFLFPVC